MKTSAIRHANRQLYTIPKAVLQCGVAGWIGTAEGMRNPIEEYHEKAISLILGICLICASPALPITLGILGGLLAGGHSGTSSRSRSGRHQRDGRPHPLRIGLGCNRRRFARAQVGPENRHHQSGPSSLMALLTPVLRQDAVDQNMQIFSATSF